MDIKTMITLTDWMLSALAVRNSFLMFISPFSFWVSVSLLTSKSTIYLYKHLQEQMKERPELPQTASEVTKFYGKVLENVRFRANRLRRFAR